jgi:hypothetical protein
MLIGIGTISVFTATIASDFFQQQEGEEIQLRARLGPTERKLDQLREEGARHAPARRTAARARGPGAERAAVAVLTHGYWQRVFGGDPSVVGQTLDLTVKQATIVGVLAPGSHYATQRRTRACDTRNTNGQLACRRNSSTAGAWKWKKKRPTSPGGRG